MGGRDERLIWDLAGITDIHGSVDRPADIEVVRVPTEIDLDGDRLVWTWSQDAYRTVRPDDRMLTQFVKLDDASDEQILRYARRWGVLEICRHNVPRTHKPLGPSLTDAPDPVEWCESLGWPKDARWEPLEAWRHFAGQARALLNIVAQLRAGKPARYEDWNAVAQGARTYHGRVAGIEAELREVTIGREYAWDGSNLPPRKRRIREERIKRDKPLNGEWARVTGLVNDWMDLGNIRPRLYTEDGRVAVRLGGGETLFGALAVQLALAISRTDGLAICSACGAPYLPVRRPSLNRRHYCPDCSKWGAWRDAARDYRRRKKMLEAENGEARAK